MRLPWKSLREDSPKWLKTIALAAAGVGALYIGAIQPLRTANLSREQQATGLGWQPVSLWQRSPLDRLVASREREALATDAQPVERIGALQEAGLSATPPTLASQIADDRKMVRTSSIDLVVKSPSDSADKVRQLAESVGGYLETSQVSGASDATSASLTIRVPAARFEKVRAEIRKLGLRVESERVEAQDVTKQYVDQEARLRNLRAEESQYLAILKHAATVSDTLEVSEKLSEVRGNIEQQQAEFDALSRQVETVAITVSLSTEADTQVFGLQWRPLYRLKLALRDGLNGLADYASTMAAIVFYLPAVLLWMGTILLAAAVGYRILRWAARVLFVKSQSAVAKA
jgi:hypothetical protein